MEDPLPLCTCRIHVQHPLPSLHDYNMKIPDETFVEDGNRRKPRENSLLVNITLRLNFSLPFLNCVASPIKMSSVAITATNFENKKQNQENLEHSTKPFIKIFPATLIVNSNYCCC